MEYSVVYFAGPLCRALCGGARQLVWVRKKLFNVLRKVLYVIRVRVVLYSD